MRRELNMVAHRLSGIETNIEIIIFIILWINELYIMFWVLLPIAIIGEVIKTNKFKKLDSFNKESR